MNPNPNKDEKIIRTYDGRVLLLPAMTQSVSGKPLFFVFSTFQVEDIIKEVSLQSVPFSPDYAEGIALWRNHVVPVVSLDKCLGLKPDDSSQSVRYVLVRSIDDSNPRKRTLIKTLSAIRMVSLPIICKPVPIHHLFSNPVLIRGLYEWNDGYLIAVNMENILNGMMK